MPLSLHFVHGWGCDASLWDGVAPLLGDWPQTRSDRGYFGGTNEVPQGRFLVVAHSLGVLRTLLDPPPRCAGLVAINGFDRFGQARVLGRMIARLADDPQGVLDAFRARIGLASAPPIADVALLAADLRLMRDTAARIEDWPLPLAALHGAGDPIVPQALAGAQTVADGDHLLPLTHPAVCAGHIQSLAQRLT